MLRWAFLCLPQELQAHPSLRESVFRTFYTHSSSTQIALESPILNCLVMCLDIATRRFRWSLAPPSCWLETIGSLQEYIWMTFKGLMIWFLLIHLTGCASGVLNMENRVSSFHEETLISIIVTLRLVFSSPVKSSFFTSKRGNWQPQPV